MGLDAVVPDGTIWNGLSRLRKDNTGYDLRNLLIGSEGTLGIITAAALKLFSRPEKITTAFLKVSSPSAALELLSMLRDHVGETISAFELLHKQGFSFLRETLPDVRLPFDHPSEWMVLLELQVSRGKNALTIAPHNVLNFIPRATRHIACSLDCAQSLKPDHCYLSNGIEPIHTHHGLISSIIYLNSARQVTQPSNPTKLS